ALHFADYAKALRVNEAVNQQPALDRAIFIEDKHRHMLHVVVERIAERDHLDQRREKEEKKGQRIAPDDDELLEQNCAKPSKRFVFHGSLQGAAAFPPPGRSAHRPFFGLLSLLFIFFRFFSFPPPPWGER